MDSDDAFAAKRQQNVRNKFFDDFMSSSAEPPPTKKMMTQEVSSADLTGDVDKMLLDFSLEGDTSLAKQTTHGFGSIMSAPRDSGTPMRATTKDATAAFVPDDHFFKTISGKT